MLVLTTSMPTPRPETLVTFAAVEKPARKMNCWICSLRHRRELGLGGQAAAERLAADLVERRGRGRRR